MLYVGPNETLGGEILQKEGFFLIRMIKQLFSNRAYKAKAVAAKLNQTFIHLEESLDDQSTIQFIIDYDSIYVGLSQLNEGLSRSSGEKDILHEALQSAKITAKNIFFFYLLVLEIQKKELIC